MNKQLFFFSILFITFQLPGKCWGQDTLFFLSGEQKVVELISINKSSGLITYKSDGKTTVRAMNTLRSFTNHAKIPFSEIELGGVAPAPPSDENKYVPAKQNPTLKRNITHGYPYGPFSIGVNLLSPLTMILGGSEMFHQRMYAQYMYNQHFGMRLPVSFGFSNRIGNSFFGFRQIKYEIGIEPMYYINDGMQSTLYFTLGVFTGKNNTCQSLDFPPYIQHGPVHTYYRGEINVGIQQNFSKYLAINFEAGMNMNTLKVWSIEPYNQETRTGVQARVHLVYRFKQTLEMEKGAYTY
jgi:hypothetical protein